MKTSTVIVAIVAIILIAAGAWFVWSRQHTAEPVVEDQNPIATSTVQSYASSTMGISLQHEKTYNINEVYAYTNVSPTKPIHGVSFVVPMSMATGTNLSPETYVSVEQLPNAKKCTGDIFVLDNVKPQTVTENGVAYSVATTSSAGAGNLYEETVYAIVDSKPCTAVRYFIHSVQIGNYPVGSVTEYDRVKLLSDFDAIRRSLTLAASAPASVTTPQ